MGNALLRFVPHTSDQSLVAQLYRYADVYVHTAMVDTSPLNVRSDFATGPQVCRKIVGIESDGPVLLFVAASLLTHNRKGFGVLLRALSLLRHRNINIVAVGQLREEVDHPNLIALGRVTSERFMRVVYGCADHY